MLEKSANHGADICHNESIFEVDNKHAKLELLRKFLFSSVVNSFGLQLGN